MGYRFLVVLVSVFLIGGCAAFDSGNEPYEGFDLSEIPPPPGSPVGIYTGYYAGDMTLDSNTCETVTDEVGEKLPLAVDVAHQDTTVSVTFEDGKIAAGTLEGEKVTLMAEDGSTKYVYFFEFVDGNLKGTGEIIEANADGQFSEPCATYSLELAKGEKPAGEAKEEEAK